MDVSLGENLRQHRTNLAVLLRSQILRQSKQSKEAGVAPLLTNFVTDDEKDASKCAAKA